MFLFSGNLLFSQETLELRVETSPDSPTVDGTWSVFVLVNHPNPLEVNITPPSIPRALALERVRTESRFIQGELWTSVEYSFIPLLAGAAALAPFGVSVPGRQAETGVTYAFFQPSALARRYNPAFRWLGPLDALPSGERGELFLELSDWDAQREAPWGLFRGRAPRNAILNEAAPEALGHGLFLYAISIIPLDENSVTLEGFSLQAGAFNLSVPGITVPVLPPRPQDAAVETAPAEVPVLETPMEEAAVAEITVIPFPETRETAFFFLQGEYERVLARVQGLWEENRRPQALAEIRRNERDSLAGPFLAPLRRDMERALGLTFTEDERWRPLRLPFPVWLFFIALVLAAGTLLLVFRRRLGRGLSSGRSGVSVTSKGRRGFRNVVILVFSIGLALIVLEAGWGSMRRLSPGGGTAVLKETPAHRVPDINGAVNAWFGEGQPVLLGAFHQDWSYVQSPDGRSGWVPRGALINY
ncbi:MAG: hypothetical protein FWB99_04935 [Treponema sp.]|nr:hypothetical protein [Treponema sp.]